MIDFSDIRVTVIGDVMLDRYISGEANRISPEAPVPVVNIMDTEYQLGGAGNVAANICYLGGQVSLVGVIGEDKEGERIRLLCDLNGINNCLITNIVDNPTTTKTRVISGNQQIVRMDKEQYLEPNDELSNYIVRTGQKMGDWGDIVIFSDYDKGVITKKVIQEVRENVSVPIVADPKNINFWDYKDITVLKPNRKEVENAIEERNRLYNYCVETDCEVIRSELNLDALLVTEGKDGMSLYEKNSDIHIPAENHLSVYDVTGAGDTVCAVLALGIASGMGMKATAKMANTAAGISVSKSGTGKVSLAELKG